MLIQAVARSAWRSSWDQNEESVGRCEKSMRGFSSRRCLSRTFDTPSSSPLFFCNLISPSFHSIHGLSKYPHQSVNCHVAPEHIQLLRLRLRLDFLWQYRQRRLHHNQLRYQQPSTILLLRFVYALLTFFDRETTTAPATMAPAPRTPTLTTTPTPMARTTTATPTYVKLVQHGWTFTNLLPGLDLLQRWPGRRKVQLRQIDCV